MDIIRVGVREEERETIIKKVSAQRKEKGIHRGRIGHQQQRMHIAASSLLRKKSGRVHIAESKNTLVVKQGAWGCGEWIGFYLF